MSNNSSASHYTLGRGGEEIARLNEQHNWFKELNDGELLHRSLPVDPRSFTTVADIGCGTGIWLLDFYQANHASEGRHGPELKLVGFDISSEQFPTNQEGEDGSLIEFVVHDVTKPFPEVYQHMFDLVNIRALALGLQKQHIAQAVRHVQQMLSTTIPEMSTPVVQCERFVLKLITELGGVLHWVDVEYSDLEPISAPPTLSLVWQRIEGIVFSFSGSLTLSSDLMQAILEEDQLSLKVFEKKPIPFSDTKNRARGHNWLCRIWEIVISKDSRTQEARLKSQSLAEEERTSMKQSVEDDRKLVEGLRDAANNGNFQMQYPLTWIVAQKR